MLAANYGREKHSLRISSQNVVKQTGAHFFVTILESQQKKKTISYNNSPWRAIKVPQNDREYFLPTWLTKGTSS